MSLSASTDPLSIEIDQNQVDKNLLSPPLSFSKQEKTTVPEQISNTEENAKNYVKKNGLQKFKIKSENRSIAYLRCQPMEYGSFSQENMLRFNDPLYYRNLSRVSNFLDTKRLEFETLNYQGFTPFLAPQFIPIPKNPYFGNYFPERNLIPDKIFLSGLFTQNLKRPNNFDIFRSYPNLLAIPEELLLPKKEKMIIPKEKKIKKVKASPENKEINNLIKLNFKIPDDFFINFQIKEIEIKTNQFNQYIQNFPKSKNFTFQDMEFYINNLCNKLQSKDIVNFKNDFGNEYIELESLIKEENVSNFLQRKRKLSKDKGDEGSKSKKKTGVKADNYRRHPLKKKYKKLTLKLKNLIKINNKKNGLHALVNLNQIQISKSKISLENFPFNNLINSKEITKISFLKGITDRKKDLIRINKKIGLTKDTKCQKYLNDKEFKIVYQTIDGNKTYTVHIFGINISYLILYYYYQIHKGIEQINVYHYSHSAFWKSEDEINKIEEIIKKCNHIVKKISVLNYENF